MSDERPYQTDYSAEKARETAREITRDTTAEPSSDTQTDVQVTHAPEYYTAPPPPAPRTEVYAPAPARRRPLGITVLAVLAAIAGIFMLLSAAGSFALSGALSQNLPTEIMESVPQWFLDLAPTFFTITGVFLVIVALLAFAVAWGFIKGSNWARVLAIALLAIGIIMSLIGMVGQIASGTFGLGSLGSLVLSIIIPAAIIWYLTTSHVKSWFIPGYRGGYGTSTYSSGVGRR
ncbi:hypothetical protein [Methanomassiliicoccus luminyensis]|uniref:hypothetical protein n=1 Tax=Methanomassiliicoccus luminyensis TaxID=1080712 RepID=UPI000368F14F|nr:hypothetical protein [Methanomassiliicoccus luminyensis]